MNTTELRNKIIRIVESADEKYLKQIEAFMHFKSEELTLTEEQKELLDQRLANHQANSKAGRNWNELKAELDAKYGL